MPLLAHSNLVFYIYKLKLNFTKTHTGGYLVTVEKNNNICRNPVLEKPIKNHLLIIGYFQLLLQNIVLCIES